MKCIESKRNDQKKDLYKNKRDGGNKYTGTQLIDKNFVAAMIILTSTPYLIILDLSHLCNCHGT